MAVLDIIANWLSPITDPLNELPTHLYMVQQTHLDSLTNFETYMSDLGATAPPTDQWTGTSAEDAGQWVQEYLASERALSAPGATLDVVSSAATTAIDDVGVASETLAVDVADDAVMTEVTAAVDVATVAQAGLDPGTDLASLILTVIDITLYFTALASFGWAVYQAIQALINALNQAENQPQPKLPKQPIAQASQTAQEIARQYRQEGINIDAQTIQDLLDEGYTADQIDQIIRNLQRLYGNQGVVSALNKLLALGLSPTQVISLTNLPRQQLDSIIKAIAIAQKVMASARKGKINRLKGEHGRLPAALVQEILSNPDEVYLTGGSNPKLMFRKGGNVVIINGSGSGEGYVITSYGSGGPRGDSGASIYGGSPNDPGPPVTDQMIRNGEVPIAGGHGATFPPATPISPYLP